MEIVTQPDLSSSQEAAEFLTKLRGILRSLQTCDGDMDKGSLRCDANVSVRRPGAALGTRCEIKNLNSIKNITKAVDYEVARQIALLESGGVVMQETKLFDAAIGETRTLRTKESSDDYRYFPDPDLLPLILTDEYIAKIQSTMPELPDQKKKRYMETFSLSAYDASALSIDSAVSRYFEDVMSNIKNPKLAANWITVELFGRLNKHDIEFADSKITPHSLADLISLIEQEVISGKIAKEVFDIMFETGQNASEIVESKGLRQVSDTVLIEKIISETIDKFPSEVADYRAGKERLFGFFVGQIMKKSGGKINPQMLNDLLKKALG